MNHEQATQINKIQYQDEMLHKMDTYDQVKATINLCLTMIKALDASSPDETHSKGMLQSELELASTHASLAAIDVDIERRNSGK